MAATSTPRWLVTLPPASLSMTRANILTLWAESLPGLLRAARREEVRDALGRPPLRVRVSRRKWSRVCATSLLSRKTPNARKRESRGALKALPARMTAPLPCLMKNAPRLTSIRAETKQRQHTLGALCTNRLKSPKAWMTVKGTTCLTNFSRLTLARAPVLTTVTLGSVPTVAPRTAIKPGKIPGTGKELGQK